VVYKRQSCYLGKSAGVDSASEKKTSSGSGGAIYAYTRTYVDIDGSTFSANKAFDEKYGGGAVYLSNAKDPTITNCTFSANSSVYNGGAVSAYSGTNLTVDTCTFDGNTSTNNGGAVYASKSEVNIIDSDFTANASNSTKYGGGAVYFTATTANVSGCKFTGNTSNLSGGALSMYSDSEVTVEDTLFENNEAKVSTGDAGGGAMYISGGNATLRNVQFKNNTSGRNGGAFCAYSKSNVNVYDVTADSNSANYRGGAIYIGSSGTVVSIYGGEATSNTAKNNGNTIYCGGSSTLNIKTDAFTYEAGSIKGTINEITDAK
ncbi:MAG: hypothetical protein K2O39_06345, partial [Clostridiales bacterium]|nr:hypothetical protein [Clostridiales bacterium]